MNKISRCVNNHFMTCWCYQTVLLFILIKVLFGMACLVNWGKSRNAHNPQCILIDGKLQVFYYCAGRLTLVSGLEE